MNVLVDSHAVLWFLNGDSRLSDIGKETIENSNNIKYVSVDTIWEIAIKISLDKLRIDSGLKNFLDMIVDNGFEILPISFSHVITLSSLEFIHRDPFDRLIISQAITDKMHILTKDEHIIKYKIQTLW